MKNNKFEQWWGSFWKDGQVGAGAFDLAIKEIAEKAWNESKSDPEPEPEPDHFLEMAGDMVQNALHSAQDEDEFIAEVTLILRNWLEQSAQNQRNSDYYRDLLVETGKLFGQEARTADDGTYMGDVLVAKVPCLVRRHLENNPPARKKQYLIRERDHGIDGWDSKTSIVNTADSREEALQWIYDKGYTHKSEYGDWWEHKDEAGRHCMGKISYQVEEIDKV